MTLVTVAYILAVFLTLEQFFDWVSTKLVISKGRGHEQNPAIIWWMGFTGQWWGVIKLPAVVAIWVVALQASSHQYGRFVVAGMILVGLIYLKVVYTNYKIAWRQD